MTGYVILLVVVVLISYLKYRSYEKEKKHEQEEEDYFNNMNEYNKIGINYICALESLDLRINDDRVNFLKKVINKIKFIKLDKEIKYDFLFEILDRISLKDGMHLYIKVAERKYNGGRSSFYTRPPYYREISPELKFLKELVISPIYPDLNIEKSEMGAWQVYLLHISYTILPLFWHAGYCHRTYFFDVPEVESLRIRVIGGYEVDIPTKLIQVPNVIPDKDKFIVSCTYWNDWKGLVREIICISFLDDGNIDFSAVEEKVLFPYECPIIF